MASYMKKTLRFCNTCKEQKYAKSATELKTNTTDLKTWKCNICIVKEEDSSSSSSDLFDTHNETSDDDRSVNLSTSDEEMMEIVSGGPEPEIQAYPS